MLTRKLNAVRLRAPALRQGLATAAHTTTTTTIATHHAAAAPPVLLEDHGADALNDPAKRSRIPSFTLSRARGFLPRDDPMASLPPGFGALESLLDRMTLVQPDGSKGLLAWGQLGQAVHAELKGDASSGGGGGGGALLGPVDAAIASGNHDVMSALFRDLSFLASAYLLEPVDLHFKATGTYCAGRDVLPACIAKPFHNLAAALGQFPFMEYASSYALQNWRRVDPAGGIEYRNLRLIRAFQDRSPEGSESGFILVHVDMVSNSGLLVSSAEQILSATNARDHAAMRAGLQGLLAAYRKVNVSMETMWGRSKPADYLQFRSFIFGTAPGKRMNAMFPTGVLYEGVSDEPMHFRGESGANDSMVPLGDNLLEITARMPNNPLTEILRDFRTYRPQTQREYIAGIEHRASAAGVRRFAEADPECLALYVLCVDQIREFRDRHWRFTKQYILERTTYNIATGGSPIATYLPSNLKTVLDVLSDACDALPTGSVPAHLAESVEACRDRAEVQKRVLEREVARLIEREEREKGRPMGVRVPSVGEGGEPFDTVNQSGEEKPLQRGAVGCDGVG